MHYTPLYIKTDGSLLTSMIKIDELIVFAKKQGLHSLTMTDSVMYNGMEFYEKCKKNGIKPIIGLEIKIENYILIVYARNERGYKALLNLSTLSTERELRKEDIIFCAEDLILIIPYLYRYLYEEYESIFLYLFVGYSTLEEKENIKNHPIYMQETLCLEKEDTIYLPYLEAIREGTLAILEKKQFASYYLHLDHSLFNENNYQIYDLCDLKISKHDNLLPVYPCKDHLDAYNYLKKLCVDGMKKRFGVSVPSIYQERLKYELSIIKKMDFCNYFLIVWDYIHYAKTHDILVGPGRGSAAGSLVSYVLYITDIDPIKYNLLFERFLNPERITMPDIDVDFEDTKREQVVSYCIQKYGEKKVAPIITFGTLGAKQAIRDVGRCLDENLNKIDSLCKLLDSKISLSENYKKNASLRNYIKEESLMQLYKVASKIEGLKRHTSIHAAGIVMSREPLDTIIPLVKNHDHFYITGYSMEYLEELGLLKMDFLAITTLSMLHEIINDINKGKEKKITFDSIPENDRLALQIFSSVHTIGIFQFESAGMKNFLRKYKPNTFEEIVSAIALYRPGPMENIDSYIKRKRNMEKVDYIHPDLKSILKPTYGIIVYQEQIMQIASMMAGYSYGQADILRKAMSKKQEDILLKEQDRFIEGSIKKGYTKEIAEKVYKLILKFASYGFNRAHSVSYSMIAYKLAYLKAYYKEYFMKHLLNTTIGNEYKTKEYLYECKNLNLSILMPNIMESTDSYEIKSGKLLYPLTGIKNVGLMAVKSILKERREQSFLDIYSFMARCYSKSMNRKVLEALIYANVFASFSYNKKTLIYNMDALINYAEIAKDLTYEYALKPEMVLKEEFERRELMQKELEVFGFYLSEHPVTEYRLKYPSSIPLSEVASSFDKRISTIVYVDFVKKILTKKGEEMCFISGSDEIMNIDLVLFPNVYRKVNVEKSNIIYIVGKVERRLDKYQIVVDTCEALE